MKILFIGFGNIAQALAEGLANDPNFELYASSPTLKAASKKNIKTHWDNKFFLDSVDVIILAIKPQLIGEVLAEITPYISKNKLIISLAAGVNLKFYSDHAKDLAIVRAMPNIAIAKNEGACALISNIHVSPALKNQAFEIFSKLGLCHWVKSEEEIDYINALSGSGPAYCFYFLKALQESGERLGLNPELSRQFTLQTMRGALSLINPETNFDDLIKKVTSLRGTTAAALEVFKKENLNNIIHAALKAAYDRALELRKN